MPSKSNLHLYRKLVRKNKALAGLHVDLVDAYSFAEAIMYGSSQSGFVLNDYLHFCYAKSARSFQAVVLLINGNFREDAFVLLRTIYENYLHFWYVFRAPLSLDSFVAAKIGRSTRKLHHPKSGPGKHLKVIDPNTGEELAYGRSMSELAKNGSPRITHKFHELAFEYLCEYTHNHFMSFGDYLELDNPSKFTAVQSQKDLEVAMYSLLLSTLWLESFPMFEESDPDDLRRIRRHISSARKVLLEVEGELSAAGKYAELMAEVTGITNSLGKRIAL